MPGGPTIISYDANKLPRELILPLTLRFPPTFAVLPTIILPGIVVVAFALPIRIVVALPNILTVVGVEFERIKVELVVRR